MEIKQRDRGYEVVDIQQRLAALGYDIGITGVDGFFGKWTEIAVKAFQKDRDLSETGIIDEQTWRQMVYATYRFGSRALYLRAPFFRGDDIHQLQLWLNSIGFRTEPVDGIFGPSTERAVREFQENVGLATDGIVGPASLAALHNLRSILDLSQDSVPSDLESPDSVVSLLQDRQIAIGCPTPHKHDWLAPHGNKQLICADLAHRLSNLLEILGAQIHFFKIGRDPLIDGEVAVLFEPGGDRMKKGSLGLQFDQTSKDSKMLATHIIMALETALEEEITEIISYEGKSLGKPGAVVLLSDLPALSTGANLKKDVFKQKIAGAVLDGLKNLMASPDPL